MKRDCMHNVSGSRLCPVKTSPSSKRIDKVHACSRVRLEHRRYHEQKWDFRVQRDDEHDGDIRRHCQGRSGAVCWSRK
ncbi:hypothetical protein JG687_00018185 [Phytophthora cactorum]|uniref:Uncharacterized protein n=1 Tax=Phytophthora cactorum TaxID=29920 RepID=A0A8T1TMB1_9STRA|nr:hypothetical protein JG687_00018185 [Phytophthora cactorum]